MGCPKTFVPPLENKKIFFYVLFNWINSPASLSFKLIIKFFSAALHNKNLDTPSSFLLLLYMLFIHSLCPYVPEHQICRVLLPSWKWEARAPSDAVRGLRDDPAHCPLKPDRRNEHRDKKLWANRTMECQYFLQKKQRNKISKREAVMATLRWGCCSPSGVGSHYTFYLTQQHMFFQYSWVCLCTSGFTILLHKKSRCSARCKEVYVGWVWLLTLCLHPGDT